MGVGSIVVYSKRLAVPSMAQFMNQSLTPTRLDPKVPFTPSNYPDKKSVVAAYKRMVKVPHMQLSYLDIQSVFFVCVCRAQVQMVLETQEERNSLQNALRSFLA